MFSRTHSSLLLLVLLSSIAGTASAQTWTPAQQEIWKLEEQQWQMAKDKDLSWIDTMVHPNVSVWDVDQPMPQNRASLARWSRYGNANNTVLEQELFPIAIMITGNIAVAQYRYVIARENYKKERETVSGRYTDVLVKENGRWLFITWAGGDDPKK
jgi:ketosteroid isomerase-like protein